MGSAQMREVNVSLESLQPFWSLVDAGRRADIEALVRDTTSLLRGRVVWMLSSTARGGGVAEMLQSLLAYVRGIGVDGRWLVMEAPPDFFTITKRLHHALHGSAGDGSPLGAQEQALYEAVNLDNAEELLGLMSPKDVVLLHDPQTAGMAPLLARTGARILWRCHIGTEDWNEQVALGWRFLRPYLDAAEGAVFSRASYIPPDLQDRSVVIPPSIDVFSAKNVFLEPEVVRGILGHTGLVETVDGAPREFRRSDGAPGRVDRQADVLRLGRPAPFDAPLIVQVSRWDPLKDPVGVMRGFCELLRQSRDSPVHLMLAGPGVHSVADDPEAAATFDGVIEAWRALPRYQRSRIHLASLPMTDAEENAAIVNALQRHAAVVVQKSLQEGFGLTVTEAMWKARPVVASAVGGIREQMVDGVHGLLIEHPTDAGELASALKRMLDETDFARACGERARQRVVDQYLGIRQLADYARYLQKVLGSAPRAITPAAQSVSSSHATH